MYRVQDGAVIDRPEGTNWATLDVAPSIVPAGPRPHLVRPLIPRCPEIDCVRHLLSPGAIALAELRAIEIGVGADRVLVAQGHISEETYAAALAAQLGIPFETLNRAPRKRCPLPDQQLIEAATTGLLPLRIGDDIQVAVVPRLVDSRRLVRLVTSSSDLGRRIRITTLTRLQRFVGRHGAREIERRAADALRMARPDLSAATPRPRSWDYADLLLTLPVLPRGTVAGAGE